MGIFSILKDDLADISAKYFIQKKLKNYGELIKLDINSGDKKIYIEIMLKGEQELLKININNYEIFHDSTPGIRINSMQVNREWLNNLAADHILGKEFPIPGKYSLIIKLLL